MYNITIETLYEIAQNDIINEFGINRFGEESKRWSEEYDYDFLAKVYNTDIDGENVRCIMDTMIDDMIADGYLKTRMAPGQVIEVYRP